jgi:hypothetical protein
VFGAAAPVALRTLQLARFESSSQGTFEARVSGRATLGYIGATLIDSSLLSRRMFVVNRALIVMAIATGRTQDVNDPDGPSGGVAGPYTGSFTSWVPSPR